MLFFKYFFAFLFIYFVGGEGGRCHGLCLEVRVQRFPPCEFWELNSGHRALWQIPLPTVSSCWPMSHMVLISRSGTFSLTHTCQIWKTLQGGPVLWLFVMTDGDPICLPALTRPPLLGMAQGCYHMSLLVCCYL